MRIHAAGELIRLARIPLVSAILVGTDKTDESLGVRRGRTWTSVRQHGPRLVGR